MSGYVFFFKQKTAYEMRISDWSSDVCSSDLGGAPRLILYAGGWRAPDWLTSALLRTGLPLLGGSQELESLIPAFRAEDQAVQMTARVPRALVGGLQAVLGSGGGGGVDLELVRAIYGALLAGAVLGADRMRTRLKSSH